jgi:hypothetical protein
MQPRLNKLKGPSFILDLFQTIIAIAVAIALALDMTGIWSGIPWLESNLPSITFIAICLLIVSAFLERHLHLDKISKDLNNKLDIIIESKPKGITLEDRTSLTIPFEKRLQNAKDVRLLGINLVGTLSHYVGFIVAKANAGCKFRILILDPNYTYSTGENPKPWKGKTRRQMDTEHSVKQLEYIQSQTENVQIGFVPSPPPFSLLLIDPEQPFGEVQVEMYVYEVPESERPHFSLMKNNDPQWYDFYVKQFELATQKSRPMKTTK